jgi:hypothetical protein
MINILNAQKLITDVNKKMDTSEYRTCTIKGVKNLSRSDLEGLQMYAEFAIKNQLNALMPLRGSQAEVWKKYNIES